MPAEAVKRCLVGTKTPYDAPNAQVRNDEVTQHELIIVPEKVVVMLGHRSNLRLG